MRIAPGKLPGVFYYFTGVTVLQTTVSRKLPEMLEEPCVHHRAPRGRTTAGQGVATGR